MSIGITEQTGLHNKIGKDTDVLSELWNYSVTYYTTLFMYIILYHIHTTIYTAYIPAASCPARARSRAPGGRGRRRSRGREIREISGGGKHNIN